MGAALLGLLGVVVGALLGGFANDWVERQKRRTAAEEALRVVRENLAAAEIRMNAGVTEDPICWWMEPLSIGTAPVQAALQVPKGDDVIAGLRGLYERMAALDAVRQAQVPDDAKDLVAIQQVLVSRFRRYIWTSRRRWITYTCANKNACERTRTGAMPDWSPRERPRHCFLLCL